MGFRLNLKWSFSVPPHFLTNPSPWHSSYSFGGREDSCDSTRVLFPSVNSRGSETLYSDPLTVHACSSSPQTLEKDYSEPENIKTNVGKRSHGGLYNMIDDNNIPTPAAEDNTTFLASFQASKASRFGLLMENLDMLEDMFAGSDVVRLERDILVQLERLGALKLFHTCLSRTLKSQTFFDHSDGPTELIEEAQMTDLVDDRIGKIVVRSGKRGERKSKRERASDKTSNTSAATLPFHKGPQQLNFSCGSRPSDPRRRRLKIARDEAEMSRGVKMLANLERIRMILEEETGRVASLGSWAEAARVNKKVLQQQLHFGWYCRDELLRSTRSLVVYLARNYRGLGVAFEDLVQAGNIGVLQGAERFDHNRGYKFSTYVHYWIRKSMMMFIAQHARGIRIPCTLSKEINQIQKARKALTNSCGKYPDDNDIAKFTGLSLAKVTSASKCLRVVGSIDQKVGDCTSARFLELTPDTSIKSPEETVVRQHMIKDIYDLLKDLDPRDRQVLVLRFGLGDHQRKSLEEIGRFFHVSKEWIRKIQRTALKELRDEETLHNLSHYLHFELEI